MRPALLLACFVLLAACSDDESGLPTEATSGGGAGGSSGSPGGAGHAGAGGLAGGQAGSGPVAGQGGVSAVQAIHHVMLGDLGPDGMPNPSAWKTVGLDLDGVQSSPGSGPHCTPRKGGMAKTIEEDGDGGIDNSFGKNILPLVGLTGKSPTTTLGTSIDSGSFTFLLRFAGLPAGDDGGGELSLLLGAGPLDSKKAPIAPTAAQWSDGSYQWNLVDSFLTSTSPPVAKTRLAGSLTGGVWLTAPAEMQLQIPLNGVPLPLDLLAARARVTLSTDRTQGTNGMIGGILAADVFVANFAAIGPKVSTILCNQGLLDGVLTQLAQAADILIDGTQDPARVCDGISIGLGFDSVAAKIGDVVAAEESPGMACP